MSAPHAITCNGCQNQYTQSGFTNHIIQMTNAACLCIFNIQYYSSNSSDGYAGNTSDTGDNNSLNSDSNNSDEYTCTFDSDFFRDDYDEEDFGYIDDGKDDYNCNNNGTNGNNSDSRYNEDIHDYLDDGKGLKGFVHSFSDDSGFKIHSEDDSEDEIYKNKKTGSKHIQIFFG